MAMDDDEVVLLWYWIEIACGKEVDKRLWIHPINEKRERENTLKNFIDELRSDDIKFRNFTRMSVNTFDYLLNMIGDKIRKHDSRFRRSIPPAQRLLVTLRFLAMGERFQSLHYYFRLGATTIGSIAIETCKVIWEELAPVHMKAPTTEQWIEIADKFYSRWNYINCLGAIDVKLIKIESPPHAGSAFFNYKHFHSISLQAVVDSDAKFMFIDVGDYGRNSDSGIFAASNFGKLFLSKKLNLPNPRAIHVRNYTQKFPFVFVGDEAYPLSVNLMRPFPKRRLNNERRIYNYRHSRARRIVECAFGMLTKKFRILENSMLLGPEKATDITLACCILHNVIREKEGKFSDIHEELLQFSSDSEETLNSNRRSTTALTVREKFVKYFISPEGAVPWQDKCAFTVA